MPQDDFNEVRQRGLDGRKRDVGPSSASDGDTRTSPTKSDAGPKSPPEHDMVVPLERARRLRAAQHEDPNDDDPGPAAA